MKRLIVLICATGFLGLGLIAHEYTIEKKEDIQKTLKFGDPVKAREVVVDNIFGSITVEGTNGQDVILVAHKTIKARSQDRIQKALEEVKLDITEKSSTVDIYVDGPFRCHDRRRSSNWRDPGYEVRYDFELKVPFKTSLDISTVNEGDIVVKAIEGVFAVDNVNGEIRMTDVAGTGEAHTVNGKIQVTFKRAPEGNCTFETVNGEVELTFPENLSADFRMKTFNGEAYSDFPVTYLQAANPLATSAPMKERKKAKFIYKSDQFFSVRAGKGGPQITLDTLNGDILIKKRTS
jgi:hypothetical protein